MEIWRSFASCTFRMRPMFPPWEGMKTSLFSEMMKSTAARMEDLLANGSSSPGEERLYLLYRWGNSSIRGRRAAAPPKGSPPAQNMLAPRGAPRALSNLVTSDMVNGQRPAALRSWYLIFVFPVSSSGRLSLSLLMTSSCSGLSPGKQPVLTQTSFSIRRCRAMYGPLLLILVANLLPSSRTGAENLRASNAT